MSMIVAYWTRGDALLQMISHCGPLSRPSYELGQSIMQISPPLLGKLVHASCERKRSGCALSCPHNSWVDLAGASNRVRVIIVGLVVRLQHDAPNSTVLVLVLVRTA